MQLLTTMEGVGLLSSFVEWCHSSARTLLANKYCLLFEFDWKKI